MPPTATPASPPRSVSPGRRASTAGDRRRPPRPPARGDVEPQPRFVHRVGDRGQFSVRVAVNTPGTEADALDIVVAGPSS
ncbi:hypothetical protein GTW71_32715 [Streptomyces sp. SID6041]|nr:hypothetical protein [Streptomyces sp. SID6041]